ncbi:MAG: hypothetical protein AAF244_00680 [Pseudomonadota bacterium]
MSVVVLGYEFEEAGKRADDWQLMQYHGSGQIFNVSDQVDGGEVSIEYSERTQLYRIVAKKGDQSALTYYQPPKSADVLEHANGQLLGLESPKVTPINALEAAVDAVGIDSSKLQGNSRVRTWAPMIAMPLSLSIHSGPTN